ncbi:Error-prone repair protein ImuA [Chitinophaga polysaccharea]|uniref:ImuA family protein n=1 Tax=Chitinophaga polysaccharea TaxID=1293035 RepID=UPI0014555DBB|nr:Error-prone repair protein ImuA [Chitinophaga polysaccharea]NLR58141.1 Error-prone repair protein ImuA [Chitinophaga polysaccharea]
MPTTKADIIAQLQKDILLLQGHQPTLNNAAVDVGLGPLREAFPGGIFPTGHIHELISMGAEEAAATSGFLSGILGCLMQDGGICIWISTNRMIFPPALQHFGIVPDQVVFVDVSRDKDALWAMEEALKCNGLAAVVGELKEISFTASRRLQLAVEQSKVTGFVHRHQPRQLTSTTCVARWQITPLVSEQEERMPGPGFPSWQVALLKMRSGKPGSWRLTWYDNCFHTIREAITALPQTPLRKIG